MIATAVMDRGVSIQALDEIPQSRERFEPRARAKNERNSELRYDLRQRTRPFRELPWPRGRQLLSCERPPQRGDGCNSRRIAGLDVVDRVTHERSLEWFIAEVLQRRQYGLRMRF